MLRTLLLVASAVAAAAQTDCYLRQNTSAAVGDCTDHSWQDKKPQKPFPSLTQCYKYNTESCCVSGHDEEISNKFKGLLSSTCLREFPDLEVYMCFGCNPLQPKYVDTATKKIRVCKSFADALFASTKSKYDACGLKDTTGKYILPSFHFQTSASFLNYYKPPLFEGFSIDIISDGDTCFANGAGKILLSVGAIMMSFLCALVTAF
jgi:hypothetical protein